MTISKEERAELRDDLARDCYPNDAYTPLLDALDASDERIASLEAEVTRFRKLFDDAGQGEYNVLSLVEYYQECVIEAGDRVDALKARIAELEAAAQWRPMDTAPRDGTWILVLLSPDLQGKADYSAASILSFRHDPFADYWRNVHWDKWNDGAGYGWLPIPALPEGGV